MSRPAPPPPPPPAGPAAPPATPPGAPSSAVPPPPPTGATGPGSRKRSRLSRVRRGVRGTPGALRLVSAALVALGLAAGLAAAQSFSAADAALVRASENAAQIVRLQSIQTNLVSADADATNAFLVGGLEPPEQRQDYTDAMQEAARLIALAAAAQPADGDALALLNADVQEYTEGVALARANNRQGLPVGAQYLRAASGALRADTVGVMDALQAANEERAQAEFARAGRAGAVVLVVALAGLTAVVVASVWLARRTHRYVNVPVAGAGAMIAGVFLLSAILLGSVAGAVSGVRTGPYATARALADARIAAFDAKANESLTLIARGSGAVYETAWAASADVTAQALADAERLAPATGVLEEQWSAYTTAHAEIRALDEGGDWDGAVAAASSREPGSANDAFDTFDASSAEALALASTDTSEALRGASSGLQFWAWVGVLSGLAAAALAWRGLAQRIEEYR